MNGEHSKVESVTTDPVSHTPGPWIQFALDGRTVAICPAGRDGDICELDDDRPHAESDANARLITAAPDLLASLRAVRDWMDNPELPICPLDIAMASAIRLAVAKAERRS